MSDEKIMDDPRYMALPPLRMMLGTMPLTAGKGHPLPAHIPIMPKDELEIPVKRLIAHLEEKMK
jgi:hypothetical protein